MENVPDLTIIMTNIVNTFPSIYRMLAWVFIFFSLLVVFDGILDLAASTDRKRKYFGGRTQPTGWSGLAKIIIAGFIFNLASNGQMISITSSIFFSDYSYTLVTLENFQDSGNGNELSKITRIAMIGFTQIVGIVAVFKGLLVWIKASDGTGRETFWHGAAYILFGTLCVQIGRFLGAIQATLGFDFFKMIGLV